MARVKLRCIMRCPGVIGKKAYFSSWNWVRKLVVGTLVINTKYVDASDDVILLGITIDKKLTFNKRQLSSYCLIYASCVTKN